MDEVPITIIGGGVVGLAIAHEFSSHLGADKVFLFEKNNHLGQEQSGRNSEVLHSGIYYSGLKARLARKGNELIREFCWNYDIALVDTGKLVVACSEEEDKTLDKLMRQAQEYDIPCLQKVTKQEATQLQPDLTVFSALYSKSTATIDSATYIRRLSELTRNLGAQVLTNSTVSNIFPEKDGFTLEVTRGKESYQFKTRVLINSAGLYADEIAKKINPDNRYEIVPVKGEYLRFAGKNSIQRNIYPIPWQFEHAGRTYYDLGVHLTPLVDGTVRVGPAVMPARHKQDYRMEKSLNFFYDKIKPFFPTIKDYLLQPDYAGVLAEEKNTSDFIIERDRQFPQCLQLVGIESPGLTASLAIGQYCWKLLEEIV